MNASFLKHWSPVLAGLLVLYTPTYYDLSQTIWTEAEYVHGPMILLAVLWLFWREKASLLAPPQRCQPGIGGFILGMGLILYAIGRSQEILLFEVGSQIPVIAGTLLIAFGAKALKKLWFPLFFLVFLVPLPGFFVDGLTNPLKKVISGLAEESLYALGYPIARDGVVLTIGPYQLLVADACSGLHSMFSLSAMGLLYLYILDYKNKLKNGIIIASIIPIAFSANVVRVIILVLITYHFGDAAGQGFIHKFAGIILFAAALMLLFIFDAVLDFLFKRKNTITM